MSNPKAMIDYDSFPRSPNEIDDDEEVPSGIRI